MKKKRFSVEKIVAVLKQAELGMPVVCSIYGHTTTRFALISADRESQRTIALLKPSTDHFETSA